MTHNPDPLLVNSIKNDVKMVGKKWFNYYHYFGEGGGVKRKFIINVMSKF